MGREDRERALAYQEGFLICWGDSITGKADKTVRQVGTGNDGLTSPLMIPQPCLSCGSAIQPQFLGVSIESSLCSVRSSSWCLY